MLYSTARGFLGMSLRMKHKKMICLYKTEKPWYNTSKWVTKKELKELHDVHKRSKGKQDLN